MDIIAPSDRGHGRREGLAAVSLHQRLETRQRVYLEKVKRQDRKEREEEQRHWRVDVFKAWAQNDSKIEKRDNAQT